jgi:hypothetical protein
MPTQTPANGRQGAAFDKFSLCVLMPLAFLQILAVSFLPLPAEHARSLRAIVTLIAITFLLTVFKMRRYTVCLQDRVIRLEERLRYAALLTPADLARAQALTTRQIIALRFASDAELPALLHRTLAENLEPSQIKESIEHWRPDHARV